MSIKLKVAIIIIAIFLALEVVNLGVQQFIMLPGFLSLEKGEAIKDAKRVEEAIQREIAYLDSLTHDWAAWDETYNFVAAPNDEYIQTNLTHSAFMDNHLSLVCMYTDEGRLVWLGVDGVTEAQKSVLTEFFGETLSKTHPLLSFPNYARPLFEVSTSGIITTAAGPMVISSRPVLTSDNEGPARGYLILAYFLDDVFVENIAGQTHVDFNLLPFQEGIIPKKADGVMTLKGKEKSYMMEVDLKAPVLKIYSTIEDIEGKKALVIEGRIDRKIIQRGFITMRYAIDSLMIAGVTALIVMMLLIQWAVLKPIARLTASVVNANKKNYNSNQVFSNRRDEIGILAREFDNILIQLNKRSKRLLELNATLMADIEKRKQAEAALRESEERFKILLESLPVGVFVHDLDGKVLFVNEAACVNTGYSREELLTKSMGDINTDTINREENERLWKKIGEGIPIVVEGKKVRKDGSSYPAEVHLTKIVLDGKPIIMALSFDITERKQAEEALRISEEKLTRSKKMESLGLLAGGVAHDLNNVLSGIVSYPELILMDLPEESKLINPIKTMQTSGKRAVAIVQDLLTVARGVAVEKLPLSLNQIVNRYLESAEHGKMLQYHSGVVVRSDLEPQLLSVKGSPIHIGKSLMNLVSNAAEAIDGSGEIIIRTRNRYLDQPLKGYEEVNTGEYAVLTVKDNGQGISPNDLERIFEPFYTKKVMGRSGTGLGLAIVWNVLQEHKGYIDVTSDRDGTTFELYFPITREAAQKRDVTLSIQDYSGKGEKILVVDDIESQREIFCNMLRVLGYRPASVSGGEAAVEYLKDNTVDLLILDMIMDPGINGRETYRRILEIHPGQKAIIVSGFAETDDVKETQRLGAGRYVKKPVQLEKIGLAIKAELSR